MYQNTIDGLKRTIENISRDLNKCNKILILERSVADDAISDIAEERDACRETLTKRNAIDQLRAVRLRENKF